MPDLSEMTYKILRKKILTMPLTMHCKLLMVIILILCRKSSEMLAIINMKKIDMESVKSMTLVVLSSIIIILALFIISDYKYATYQAGKLKEYKYRLQVCHNYINDLESAIEEQDFDVADVCATDAYCEYYNIYDRK